MAYDIYNSQFSAEQMESAFSSGTAKIDDSTKHWMKWDITSQSWVDTGVTAEGQDYTITEDDYDEIATLTAEKIQPTITELDDKIDAEVTARAEAVSAEATAREAADTVLKADIDELSRRVGEVVYGFHINANDSNPSTAVTYLKDAVGMTPMAMDYTNDSFSYGSWNDAFFMPKPCMLKSDGTVDYYLNPNDYTKKADGTDSDVSNTSYDGNAMMEWGDGTHLIWLKIVADDDDEYSGSVYIADHKADDDFTCYPFINVEGDIVPHFYTPIYNGSLISSKLRSISGQTVMKSKNAQAEIDYARANYNTTDPIWNTEVWCDIQLINALLILCGKTLNVETPFGKGNQSSGSESTLLATGSMNTKGLFWGKNVSSSSDNSGVKVFGMENWWGNQWRRFAGLINDNGTIKAKLCYGQTDGSTVDDYNITGDGYTDIGVTPIGTSGGYVNKSKFAPTGMYPSVASGSAMTYYSDGLWFNNSQVGYASRGGPCNCGSPCGAFCLVLNFSASTAYWGIGSAPSCKPLK